MARFEEAIGKLLQLEGGYVNNPQDPGGITQYGISLRFLKDYGLDVDHSGSIDAEDIKKLTPTEAQEIYRQEFWKGLGLDTVVHQGVANKLLDLAVNMGCVQAVKLLQAALGLPDDGSMGPVTLTATNAAGSGLLDRLRLEAVHFYLTLVDRKPKQFGGFLRGWVRRALA